MALTHEPTSSGPPHHDPTTCFLCGRRAVPYGIGKFGREGNGDPKYLCEICLPLAAQIKAVTRFDRYEVNAIEQTAGMVFPLVERNGFDLSEWSEQQVHEFIGEIIMSFGHAIREQVRNREVPF